MQQIEEILSFWFGPLTPDGLPVVDRSRLWFGFDRATDGHMRQRFEGCLAQASQGKLASWERQARGRLALILLLDQFSRNIDRATPRAFAQDEMALSLCLAGIDRGHDQELSAIERVFFYMPLQHCESLAMQDRCVEQYQRLLQGLAPGTAARLRDFLDHAQQHRDIIRRFGRFPHRNRILGRDSTAAEREYLHARTGTFGQG
jgi:uncharacterized protein (DUF924 family)